MAAQVLANPGHPVVPPAIRPGESHSLVQESKTPPRLEKKQGLGETYTRTELPNRGERSPIEASFSSPLAFGTTGPGVSERVLQAPKGAQALTQNTEKSPFTQKSAASMNTAHVIAGLKPWSRDWVFGELPQENMKDIQPLISSDSPKKTGDQSGPFLSQAPQKQEDPAQALKRQELGNSLSARSETGVASANRPLATAQTAAVQPTLASYLQALNGEVQTVSPEPSNNSVKPGVSKEKRPWASGGEFLDARSGVRTTGVSAGAGVLPIGQSASGTEEKHLGSNPKSTQASPSLKVIEGGAKERKSVFEEDTKLSKISRLPEGETQELSSRLGTQSHAPLMGTDRSEWTAPASVMTGHTVKGKMSQDRLSTESLMGISAGIKNLGASGHGEIRVRLKPENLGELHLRVTTRGSVVGLQIQASDERAKIILEESMRHLKDSLTAQHLTLGPVDLSVSQFQSSQNSSGSTDMPGNQGSGPQPHSDFLGQNMRDANQGRNQERSGTWTEGGDLGSSTPLRTRPSSAVAQTYGSGSTSGKIDVKA